MENYFFHYKLTYYDCGEEVTAEGLTFGSTWQEVMKHLVDYYGEHDLFKITLLTSVSDGGDCVEFEELNYYTKEMSDNK